MRRLSLSPVGESVRFTGSPGEFSFFLEIVSTDPGSTSVRPDGLVDGVVLDGGFNGSEVSSPFKAELSSVSPSSLEVVKGVLLLSVGEGLGRLPGRRSGLGSDSSLADVGGSGITVSVVPLASGVGSIDLSTSFGFSSRGEPVPSHGSSVSPFPVVLGGFTTDPSASDSVGSTADLVLSNKSVSGSLLGPRVNGREVTTPRSANVSGGFPGLLVSSEEEFELSVLVLVEDGSLANERFSLVARSVLPSVSGERFHEGSAHLLLVLLDLLGVSRGPEFPSEAVALGGIRPVPGSLKVEGVSSHPGFSGVSSVLGDFVLLTVVLDGSKLTTVLRGTSRSSSGPGLGGSEEFVLEARFRAGRCVRSGVLLVSSAHELSLVVALALSEFTELSLQVEGTAISVVRLGHVKVPVVFKNTHFGSFLVGPLPDIGVLEIVVTNPGVGSGNSSHSLGHDIVFNVVFSGGKLTTGFTAVCSSGVPVVGFLGDPVSPGVSLINIGLNELACASRPPDTSSLSGGNDSSSFTNSNVFVAFGDFDPRSVVFAHHLGLEGGSVFGSGNERSFGTDRDVSTSVDSFHGHPSVSVGTVNLTILTADNGVSVSINSDSGSFRSEHGVVAVFVNLTADTSGEDVVS